jgi:hypothetical protein
VKIGIVVPTLGRRPIYLNECLVSVRRAGDVHICIVAPEGLDLSNLLDVGLIDQVIEDPRLGLAAAIDAGLRGVPSDISYVNWIGDDDLLAENSLDLTSHFLDSHPDVDLVFGSCRYIDEFGRLIWTNRSGSWAKPLMRFGPCLVPQPGSLFRRSKYIEVGGLDPRYKWAFDFDLFIKISKTGKLAYLPKVLAAFRWHPGSLSVGGREGSVREASSIRRRHLPVWLRCVAPIWEIPVQIATQLAGKLISLR